MPRIIDLILPCLLLWWSIAAAQEPEEDRLRRRKLLDFANSEGTLKVLVIPLAWSDTPSDRTLPSMRQMETMWFGEGTDDDGIPSGSLREWVRVNSYGKLDLDVTIVDWIDADNTEIHYAAGRSAIPNGNQAGTVQIADSIFHALERLESTGFDFSEYDQDGDGYIDAIALMHSGYASEAGNVDCSNQRGKEDRIHSHMQFAPASGPDVWVGPNGIQLGGFIVSSVFMGVCNSNVARIGTFAHELVHLFDMPELYDVAGLYKDEPCGCVGGVSGYDVMANQGGQNNLLGFPGHLSPWSKYRIDWLEPTEIDSSGTYTLRPSELYPDAYMISSPYPDGEYLVLEVRRPLKFDAKLWEPGGLLIYHVDDNAEGPGNQIRGFPGQEGWPGNGNHYTVALLQRDGRYDLEKAANNGEMDDFWIEGTTLGPGNGEQVADKATYPNSDSYAFGDIQVTGVIITNIVENEADGSVTFEVLGLEGTSAPTVSTLTPTVGTSAPTVSACGNITDASECAEGPSCVWCMDDDICREDFGSCPGINAAMSVVTNECLAFVTEDECSEDCFWCAEDAKCHRDLAECIGNGRLNRCMNFVQETCDATDSCVWDSQLERCTSARGFPGNATTANVDLAVVIECATLSTEDTCTGNFHCRWCNNTCQTSAGLCSDGSLGVLGNPCAAVSTEEECTSIFGCLFCAEAPADESSQCQPASNHACVETTLDDQCLLHVFGPECEAADGCQWCNDFLSCRSNVTECSEPASAVDVNILAGTGGRFEVWDAALGQFDPNAISVVLSHAYEVTEAGETIETSFVDLTIQEFKIKQTRETFFGDVPARRIEFTADVENVGTIMLEVYIMLGEGTIAVQGVRENWIVNPGAVKFSMELSDWTYCDMSPVCGDSATDELTSSVDVAFSIQGLYEVPLPGSENALIYNLGGNVPLLLSSQVVRDDFVENSPVGFPRAEPTDSQGTYFVFRLPRFEIAAGFDPLIPYHYSIPAEVTLAPTMSPSAAPAATEAPSVAPTEVSGGLRGSNNVEKDDGLSGGAITGIVIGVLFLCCCIPLIGLFLSRRNKEEDEKNNITIDVIDKESDEFEDEIADADDEDDNESGSESESIEDSEDGSESGSEEDDLSDSEESGSESGSEDSSFEDER